MIPPNKISKKYRHPNLTLSATHLRIMTLICRLWGRLLLHSYIFICILPTVSHCSSGVGDAWLHGYRCQVTQLSKPSYTVADACYPPITGISYCRGRHLQQSWKASERVLGGIVINVPPILPCRDDKMAVLTQETVTVTAVTM